MRIIQLSDVHVWRYSYNPFHLFNKRVIGTASLLAGRACQFPAGAARLGRGPGPRPEGRPPPDHRRPDHDRAAGRVPGRREALADLLVDPSRVTVIPGNHDRYTDGSVRRRQFEKRLSGCSPPPKSSPGSASSTPTPRSSASTRPARTSRPGGSAPGPARQGPRALLADPATRPRRLIVASHYPVYAPQTYAAELKPKRMRNDARGRRLAGAPSALISIAAATSTPPGPSRPAPAPQASSASTPGPHCSATHRPPPPRLPRDRDPRSRRLGPPPRLGRQRLGSPPPPPGPAFFPAAEALPTLA